MYIHTNYIHILYTYIYYIHIQGAGDGGVL